MNRRGFLRGIIATAAIASAGLHKLGLGRLVTENAAAEAKAPKVEALTDAERLRADKWMRDLQAVVDAIEPNICAVVLTQRSDPPPPEHPRCQSWFSTHDA